MTIASSSQSVSETTTTTDTATTTSAAPPRLRRWRLWGAVAVGVVAVGAIPLPHHVTGSAAVQTRSDARQRLVMPVSGRVELKVESQTAVQPGQVLGRIRSDDLDNQLAQAQREWQQARLGVQSAQQQLSLAQARWAAAERRESIALEGVERAKEDTRGDLPQRQRWQRERDVLPAQVAAIEAEIAGIEAEIVGLQGQLTAVQKTVTALTSLQSHGAIREADLWEAQGRLASLTAQISQRRGLMAAKRQEIEQQHGWMAAKTAQMDEVDFQFAKTALAARDDYQAQATYTETARTEVATAEAHLRASEELAARWQLDVQQLEQQRSQLTLVATHAGTVITPDLDLLDGTRLEAGQELLTVVDLQQLTAEVEIRQEDLDWVQPGARVRFRRPADSRVYEAVVTDAGIVPVVQTSEQQQRPMLKVRILIDNSQEFLLPGVEGYAHIQTQKVCLARKVSREFQKLFPWGKFFSWL